LSVGVEQNKIFGEAFRLSAGDLDGIPLTGMREVTFRVPAVGFGSGSGRRDRSVGPR
jgi:hypothetical protein